MLGSPPPVDVLEPEGWAHNAADKVVEWKPQWCKGGNAYFKHSRELQAQDVLMTQVVEGGAGSGYWICRRKLCR